MHFTKTSALVAALASVSIASPIEDRNAGKFTVEQVSVGKKLRLHPAVSMLKTYKKFNKAAPASIAKAAAAAVQSGSVTATPEQYDESYLVPVTVGNKVLNLDFDTGSSDLWVYSTLQPSSQTSGHSVYNPSDGTSTLKSGYSWEIQYGDGSSAGGKVYGDKVVVGAVTATSQAVEAATSVSSEFLEDVDNDGLLGLAFSSINTVEPVQQTTFFDTVKSTLAQKLFTADLKKGAPGTYGFGFIDSSKYVGSITYVAVNNGQGFWQFTAGGYGVNGGAISGSIGTSIADTGTTLWYLPTAAVSAYYKKVSGSSNSASAGGYVVPCNAALPSFSVSIGGTTFTVPGSSLIYAPVSGNTCFGGIQANTGIGFSIFGDIFLKNFFVVFDETQASPRLGFANQ